MKQDVPDFSGEIPFRNIDSSERIETLHDPGYSLQLELFRNHQKVWRKNEEIERERRRYTNLFNLAPMGFLALDENHQIVEANVASAILLMTPSRSLAGADFIRFIAPSDRDLFYAYRKRARFNTRDSFELELINPLGRRLIVRFETVLTREMKWLIGMADVTPYKNAEQELTGKRDELQEICERLRDERDQRFQAEEELRRFSQRLIVAQEKERQRIARELHDQVGQLMTYLGLLLDKARFQLDPGLYRDAKSVAKEVLTQIRDLSFDLQPSMLRSIGLVPSLQDLVERYNSMTGIQVELSSSPTCGHIAGDPGLVAYRIVQEALTNIARHARVNAATVNLTTAEGKIRLSIEDCGKGFDLGLLFERSGITGMRERAQSIGGSLYICSAPGQGTTVVAELPVIESADVPAQKKTGND